MVQTSYPDIAVKEQLTSLVYSYLENHVPQYLLLTILIINQYVVIQYIMLVYMVLIIC